MYEAINTGDTAWILISAALAFFSCFVFAIFYGSLARQSPPSSLLKKILITSALLTLQWIFFGYTIVFGQDHGGWIGTWAMAGLRNVGLGSNLEYAGTVPNQAFMIYQAMSSLAAPAIFLAAFSERLKFSSFCIFILAWATLVYDLAAHWIWNTSGFLRVSGALDFSGGIVIHVTVGMAVLAAVLALGPKGNSSTESESQLNITTAAGSVLWLIWFVFNTGKSLSSGEMMTSSFVAAHCAATAATIGWILLEYFVKARPSRLGFFSGTIGGLVAISPAAGYVGPWDAILIGFCASSVIYFAILFLKARMGDDNAFDVVAIHGAGGIWGALATGIWASKDVNSVGGDGLFSGNPGQLLIQFKAACSVSLFVFGMTWLLLKGVDLLIGLRPIRASKGPFEE